MTIASTIPTVAAVPGDTILGQKCIFGFEEAGGSQENIRAKIAGLTPTIEKLERQAPDSEGILATDRTVVISKKWTIRLTTDEFSANFLKYFNDAYRKGKGRIWIEDPDDATDTVSLLSNEFECTCYPDSETSFAADQFSEGAIIVDINGTFTLTRDGDVS